ncbi:hypothetical protein F2P81_017583 [Scophthalmus maximus]|uniref:Uncharacterized protein n=1 Tax=Scophthalmus maximus TaxID=52904 RepID=A0A6A4SKG9_SCOMX|nr:hypothetical protein F2P81_017583 [Scophthalmus maximus]
MKNTKSVRNRLTLLLHVTVNFASGSTNVQMWTSGRVFANHTQEVKGQLPLPGDDLIRIFTELLLLLLLLLQASIISV